MVDWKYVVQQDVQTQYNSDAQKLNKNQAKIYIQKDISGQLYRIRVSSYKDKVRRAGSPV
jgi:hypothetical protein